jgi:hypothetical protein
MRFVFRGHTYALEFSRNRTLITTYKKGKEVEQLSKYPSTTATIYRLDPKEVGLKNAEVIASETVGCNVKDRFDYEVGRRNALRKTLAVATRLERVTKDFRTVMWAVYFNRSNGSGKPPATPITPLPTLDGELVSTTVH